MEIHQKSKSREVQSQQIFVSLLVLSLLLPELATSYLTLLPSLPTHFRTMPTEGKNWLPLESNPELMNKYVHSLGVPETLCFHEVFGVDEMLLGMVPQPVYAVLLLFPISEASEGHKDEEEEKIKQQGQKVSPAVYHIKQVGTTSGTGRDHTWPSSLMQTSITLLSMLIGNRKCLWNNWPDSCCPQQCRGISTRGRKVLR